MTLFPVAQKQGCTDIKVLADTDKKISYYHAFINQLMTDSKILVDTDKTVNYFHVMAVNQ